MGERSFPININMFAGWGGGEVLFPLQVVAVDEVFEGFPVGIAGG
jgi:hypothetical protein